MGAGTRPRDELVQSIFMDALEIGSRENRLAYLDRHCGVDVELRAEVETLLRHHAACGDYLEHAAMGPNVTHEIASTAWSPSPDGPGTVIGPYKLLQLIGEGGMGTIWMAQQTEPVKRLVAVKLIKAGMDSRQIIARFEAERQALALMDHANIARVLDAGTTSASRPYFVMELVKGAPITSYCDEHHLTPRERLELFIPVCEAIQHAHHKGIIHRDLKPSNVLIALYDGKPVPKVIDFGVAKATGQALTEKTLVTGFGSMVGTLEYMSPEQAELNQLDIDTRSDIYALGVLLYELLTGTTPLQRKRLERTALLDVLRLIREEEPPRPSTRLSTTEELPAIAANRGVEQRNLSGLLRGELDWIVMKALEKDRTRRYETANSFARDVQRYLDDEAVQACPPSTRYRVQKFVRRNKSPVVAGALLLLALVAGVIGTTAGMIRATHAEAKAVSEANLKSNALLAVQQSERASKDSLWLSLYEQARARRFSRQMGQRLSSLEAVAQAARIRIDDRLRDEAIAAMALPDVQFGPTWHGWPPGYADGFVDGDYRLFAHVSDQGVISIRTLPDDREIQSIVSTPTLRGVLLSPDGRYLANFEPRAWLRVWRVADRAVVLRQQPGKTLGWAFSPDSRQLAIGLQVRHQGWILRFDLATGKEKNRWQLPYGARANEIAFHPDNHRLAVGYEDASFASVYESTTGELVASLPVGPIRGQVVAWHPDGARLAVGGSDPRIQIWNVPGKRKLATLEGHIQQVVQLTFHPRTDLLASTSRDGFVRLWDPATGRQLLHFSAPVVCRLSVDGRYLGLARHGEQAKLVEVTPTREYRTLGFGSDPRKPASNWESDISPDGRILAQANVDATRLWHLATCRQLAALPPGRPLFRSQRELLIVGPGGVSHWPIQSGPGINEVCVGPPRTVALPATPGQAELSSDRRTLAIVSRWGETGLLLDLDTDSVRDLRFDHWNIDCIALSRDARWLATGGWRSGQVRLWDVETGSMVNEWRLTRAMVFFTPDSRALIISQDDGFIFWDLATLEPIRRIPREVAHDPGHVAFSADGSLMALEMAPGIVQLKDVATARTVARLEDPHGDRAGWMSFTPDGTQLVVTSPLARAVHIWDLRLIRQRLGEMGLDWDTPPNLRADLTSEADQPPQVRVLLGDQAQLDLSRDQNARQWIEEARGAVEAKPDSAKNCDYLARAYLTAPLALRDVQAALPLAEKAVRLEPGSEVFANTLGLAYYRVGRYREAVETLRPNLDRQDDSFLAFDLYLLAMSHHRLGEAARARDYYDWAVRWTTTRKDVFAEADEHLDRFRAEAEQLMKKGPEKKPD
jgi:serine/threonine protein kinase/WD40 repeat protein